MLILKRRMDKMDGLLYILKTHQYSVRRKPQTDVFFFMFCFHCQWVTTDVLPLLALPCLFALVNAGGGIGTITSGVPSSPPSPAVPYLLVYVTLFVWIKHNQLIPSFCLFFVSLQVGWVDWGSSKIQVDRRCVLRYVIGNLSTETVSLFYSKVGLPSGKWFMTQLCACIFDVWPNFCHEIS